MVPRPTWYWSKDAKYQRAHDKELKLEREGKVPASPLNTNNITN